MIYLIRDNVDKETVSRMMEKYEGELEFCDYNLAMGYLENQKTLAVDVETTGLSFLDDKMVLFQTGTVEEQFIVDVRYGSTISPFKKILENRRIKKVLHNAVFDYCFIRKHGIRIKNMADTMLQEQILLCGKTHPSSLKELVKKYLGETIQKSIRLDFTKSYLTGQFSLDQLRYAAKDIVYPLQVFSEQKNLLKSKSLEEVASLENEALETFADMHYEGCCIDKPKWLGLADVAAKKAAELHEQLDDQILERNDVFEDFIMKYVQGDLFRPVEEIRKVNVLWSSPTKVLKVMKKVHPNITTLESKKIKVKKKDSLLELYLKYSEQNKLTNSYGEKYLKKYVKSDGRIHPKTRQIIRTGRTAVSDPNIQQIPSSNDYRNCFIPNYEDFEFVSLDYSGQELCIIAEGSKEPSWMRTLLEKKDLHSHCAELIFGKKWKDAAQKDCLYYSHKTKCDCELHKMLRYKIKTINFGLAYGASPSSMSHRMGVSVEDATYLVDRYFDRFSRVKAYLKKLGDYALKQGYSRTFEPFGRIRYYPEWKRNWWQLNKGVRNSIRRKGTNHPIQGTAADMMKLAEYKAHRYLDENDLHGDIKIIFQVHDQLDTIARKETSEFWFDKLAEIMEEAAKIIIPSGIVRAEGHISKNWKK